MLYQASGGTAIVGPMFCGRLTNSLSFFSTLVLFCLQHIASCMGDACWKEPVAFWFPAIFPESHSDGMELHHVGDTHTQINKT